ncbi:ATP-binding protein [Streptomyces sanglieri]|uniref:ATP-binding protein n=1 Tax=Streptomyces sanglieri TaxID=193460 RepID=A0ABW2WL03_9ACTN
MEGRLQAARQRAFVGRKEELAAFEEALCTGGRVLFIHGPGGVGKSALLGRFAQRAAAADRTVLMLDGRSLEESPQPSWPRPGRCSACAQATAHSAIVPEPTTRATAPHPDALPERRKQRERGPGAAVRIQEMLSYLAAALPSEVGAAARLLALQCALRATVSGRLWMPAGLLRGLRMNRHSSLWQELEQSGWLTRLATNPPWAKQRGFAVQLLDAAVLTQAPGRRDRAHAADAALRLTSCPALRSLSASEQLAGLALATYLSPATCTASSRQTDSGACAQQTHLAP